MKQTNNFMRRIVSAMFAALILTVLSAAADAQTTAFTYQGRLTDGTAAASGTFQMQFTLYDQASGGTVQGATITNNAVVVASGVFTVVLDFSPATPFAAGGSRFLEIAVKKPAETGFTTLTPRQPITSSPYSIRTLNASVADGLSAVCVGCVTDAQINSLTGAKISGTVANANTANTANTATTADNVTGVVAVANGGTGNTTRNFVDLTSAEIIGGAKRFSGNTRTNGPIRSGSETGTAEIPVTINSGLGYVGLVTRRINSTVTTAGSVIARSDNMTLERDGTNGGLRVSYTANFTTRVLHCSGINSAGASVNARVVFPTTAGTTQVYTNAQNVEFAQCSFGEQSNVGQLTQVTIQRVPADSYWIGTLTSTFNQ